MALIPTTVRPCPTPAHDHVQYLEHREADHGYYTVRVWIDRADWDADRPRAVTHHDDKTSALNQLNGWRNAPYAELTNRTGTKLYARSAP